MTNNELGKGAIFKNNYKEKETQPDYKGTFTATETIKAGTEISLACWVNQDKNGNSYFGLIASLPMEKETTTAKKEVLATQDDLPF